ncbi:chemotaxis protein CheA [Anaeromyxobacter paludicola]|uniref:Chemotaxis protein CheA n=1 Tax=Anaeromyxobacter paludicola TaxID=2918171 RepID=A0ABM7XCR2_9BACT|nr:chemotaxis protein CheA [Anaeromyxobacter paludicola]BDG09675.1 chemotaxis protein CheA [Anaeromyxobacter paludicola]
MSELSKYLGLFVSEAQAHLSRLGDGLVRLERAGRDGGEAAAPLVDALFRHAHSLKGMAASMELTGVAAVAHHAEDLVDALRRGGAPADPAAVDLLLAAVDALQGMVEDASRGESPPADPVITDRLLEAARAWRAAHPPVLPLTPSVPAPKLPLPEVPPKPTLSTEGGEGRGGATVAPPKPSLAAGPRRLAVTVEIAPASPVPSVRGFLVLKKLSLLGAVVRAAPDAADLKAGRIPDRRLEVELDTPEPPQAVERALSQISDLAHVRVAELAPPPPEPAPAPRADPAPEGRTVRVRTDLLDGFIDSVGELILANAHLREVGKLVPESLRPAFDEGLDRLHATVKDLHDRVMAVRMAPLALATERLPRAARDLARRTGKSVEVEVKDAGIEIDRAILEELAEPLLHVLRNAVDHGLEPPHLRLLAGKPEAGRITVAARRERDRVIVEIADDGKGMDPAKLRAAAVARGAVAAAEAAALDDAAALRLALLPGVSTAEVVTDVSGRGVGMDAVARAVEAVGGAIEVSSAPGRGARVTLRLPLTVAVQPVLLVQVAGEVLGIPIAKVHGAAQVEVAALDQAQGGPVLPYDGRLVPVHDLRRLLGFPGEGAPRVQSVVVADGEQARVGLAVDALLGQAEAVLKPLSRPLDLVAGLSAVTVLGTGRPVFILDVPRLLAA